MNLVESCHIYVLCRDIRIAHTSRVTETQVDIKMKTIIHPALFLLAAVATFHVASPGAAAAVSAAVPAAAREFLEAHNQARAAVGVEALRWSEQVANVTSKMVRYQRDKMGCQFANLTAGKYGANQLWARGTAVTPRMAVEEWVKQKQFYNHSDNSCVPNHRCGVYTQVVWRKSLELGCAQATCVKDQASLTICFYNPPGNYVGESPY
ncbi:hypothetical protein VNO78_26770 [Psophocarpus tetragonolobus]|uniref:SCP domain-containing protein n=1 Tax=Psophocarpus tetragonolobus TaxID=3891 RepID=A0AAN9S090_PSOTE